MVAERYIYRVSWSKEDEAYVGTCLEFPSLSWLADTMEEALTGIVAVVRSVVDDMIQSGETPPQPLIEKHFSGKFIVRVPPEVHRNLAIQAAESGVSLNRLITAKLASN
jgi:predicted HicB family RNase H-like nuclease